MDSRHFSTDGRLGYWAPAQVERALHWIPGKVTAVPEDLLDAPETLRSLLRYLEATGLRDPRGERGGAGARRPRSRDGAAQPVPSRTAQGFARTVLASGFPVPETLEEFRTLVAAPLLHGPPQPHPAQDRARTMPTRYRWYLR
jgi:hypothetical protein